MMAAVSKNTCDSGVATAISSANELNSGKNAETMSNTNVTVSHRDSIVDDRRRNSMELFRENSRLSQVELNTVSNDTTRRLLENMDDDQIDKAIEGLRVVEMKRRASMNDSKRRSSGGNLFGEGEMSRDSKIHSLVKNEDDVDLDDYIILPPKSTKRGSLPSGSSSKKLPSNHDEERKLSRSLGAYNGNENNENNQNDSDSESGEEGNKPPQSRAEIGRKGPTAGHSQWKPLTRPLTNKTVGGNGEEEKKEEKESNQTDKNKANEGGLSSLWNMFTRSLSSGSEDSAEVKPPAPEPKQIDGAKYFRKGKKRAEKCQFLEAVALFNFALIRQREELGKNHIDCGRTLHEIGVCWLMLGERYPALTALEEALYILQKRLGDGAEEVAEVTNNIWMVLHEQRNSLLFGVSNRDISLKSRP